MQKQIVLSHLISYLKLKKIPYKKAGKVTMIKCPFCNKEPFSASQIPNTYTVNCFPCNKKYNLIDIAKKVENLTGTEDEIIHHLKELLNINVITKKDEEKIEEVLKFYQENGFDLVPIAKGKKFPPIEKEWQNKEHKDLEEWKNWIMNGLNIGIKTGARSEKTIIDIDQKPIPEEITKLMGDTLIQESSKGFHLIYQYEEDLPKTRINELKIDIENDGGYVVIFPSKIEGIQRKIQYLKPIIKMPKELKEFLKLKIIIPKQTTSEKLREDIETEDFKLDMFEEGTRSNSIVKLGGVFRKGLPIDKTSFVLNVLNKHNKNPLPQKEIDAMIKSLDHYVKFDEEELASQILEHLKETGEMNRTELAMTIVGTNKLEPKKRTDKALAYLIKEGYLKKNRGRYSIIQRAEWKENLINIGIPIDFRMPYFYDIMNFNFGDLILIGSRNATGKTHISMNIIKQLVEQGIKPYYLSLETGSRWAKIGLQLGLKEGDFKWDELPDAMQIQLEKNAITVIDWICPPNYAETDKLLKYFVNQLQKTRGVAIIFVQLRDNNSWFAPDLIKQFPAFACRYVYDSEDSGEFGKFLMHPSKDKIREPKSNIRIQEIPCKYNWETKELKRIDEIQEQKEKENE